MAATKILTEKSLNFIINSINLGLIDFTDYKKLVIKSDNHKDFFVKIFEFDILEDLKELIDSNKEDFKGIKSLENNFFDFGFLTIKDNVLINMSLSEMLISNKLITDESGKTVGIDLNKEEWNLIENN